LAREVVRQNRNVSSRHGAYATCGVSSHVRFLLFVDYEQVQENTWLSDVFYFLTGLGHESFAVFVVSTACVGAAASWS
jgi:hypothetical protein